MFLVVSLAVSSATSVDDLLKEERQKLENYYNDRFKVRRWNSAVPDPFVAQLAALYRQYQGLLPVCVKAHTNLDSVKTLFEETRTGTIWYPDGEITIERRIVEIEAGKLEKEYIAAFDRIMKASREEGTSSEDESSVSSGSSTKSWRARAAEAVSRRIFSF